MKYLIVLLLAGLVHAQTMYKNTENPNEYCSASDVGMNMIMWNCGTNTVFLQLYGTTKPDANGFMYFYSDDTFRFFVTPDLSFVITSSNNITKSYKKVMSKPNPYQYQECDPMDRDLITGRCPSYPKAPVNINACLEQADAALRSADMMGNSISATMLRQRAIQAKSDCYK